MLGGHGAFCFGIWEDSSLTEENNFRTERGFIAPNFSPRTNVALLNCVSPNLIFNRLIAATKIPENPRYNQSSDSRVREEALY